MHGVVRTRTLDLGMTWISWKDFFIGLKKSLQSLQERKMCVVTKSFFPPSPTALITRSIFPRLAISLQDDAIYDPTPPSILCCIRQVALREDRWRFLSNCTRSTVQYFVAAHFPFPCHEVKTRLCLLYPRYFLFFRLSLFAGPISGADIMEGGVKEGKRAVGARGGEMRSEEVFGYVRYTKKKENLLSYLPKTVRTERDCLGSGSFPPLQVIFQLSGSVPELI